MLPRLLPGIVGLVLACVLCVPAAAQAVDSAQRAALVAQKLRMIEQLLGSARAQEVARTGDAESKAALARAGPW